jgi:hypothetical protein
MTRLSLSNRVARWWPKLAQRDLDQLPKGLSHQLDLLVKAMGISREQFARYKPSTRLKYVRAARHGRTVSAERERVKAQRVARQQRKDAEARQAGRARSDKMLAQQDRIQELRRTLVYEYGMNTVADENTHVDAIAARVLLSQESINEHVARYGYDYVLRRLEDMLHAVETQGVGAEQWGTFMNSLKDQGDDERWFWYHSQPTAVIFSR